MFVLLTAFVSLVVLGGLTLGGLALLKARGPDRQLPAPRARTIREMREGDAVVVMGETFLVDGSLTLEEQGRKRWAFRIQDGARKRWLYVREGDTLVIWFVENDEGLSFEARPPDTITHNGIDFRLETLGRAKISAAGQTERSPHPPQIDYYMFKGFGDHVLIVENWGQGCLSLVGRQVETRGVEFLPAES